MDIIGFIIVVSCVVCDDDDDEWITIAVLAQSIDTHSDFAISVCRCRCRCVEFVRLRGGVLCVGDFLGWWFGRLLEVVLNDLDWEQRVIVGHCWEFPMTRTTYTWGLTNQDLWDLGQRQQIKQ